MCGCFKTEQSEVLINPNPRGPFWIFGFVQTYFTISRAVGVRFLNVFKS